MALAKAKDYYVIQFFSDQSFMTEIKEIFPCSKLLIFFSFSYQSYLIIHDVRRRKGLNLLQLTRLKIVFKIV